MMPRSSNPHPVRASVFLALAAVLGALLGCDPTVKPFDDNGKDYSVFGYLNASDDTQFVRVEPLRDSMLFRAPDALNADVTLTALGTGRTVTLRDSLFRLLDEATMHNFYTTAPITPQTSYRVVVRGPGDAESRAQTTVPNTFPTPTIDSLAEDPTCAPRTTDPVVLSIRGIDRLVAVKALYYRSNPETVWPFDHLADTLQVDNAILARINYGRDTCKIPPGLDDQTDVYRIEVVVAAGDPNWPDFMGLTPDTKNLPKGASNVDGGIGYVGGIVTDTITIYPERDTGGRPVE